MGKNRLDMCLFWEISTPFPQLGKLKLFSKFFGMIGKNDQNVKLFFRSGVLKKGGNCAHVGSNMNGE